MWRRFSWSTTDTTTKPQLSQTAKDPTPGPSNPPRDAATTTKSATTAPLTVPPTTEQKGVPGQTSVAAAAAIKEHELPAQRPLGWGQRRRSSILEKLARETTKEEQNMIHYLP